MTNKRKGICYFLAGTLAFFFVFYCLNFLVFTNLKKHLAGDVRGRFVPVLIGQKFKVINASFNWQDKVRLVSGDLLIKYDAFYFLSNQRWRLQIESKNAVVSLMGDFAKSQGLTDLTLSDFKAGFVFEKSKLIDVDFLEVHSPTYQVSLK